MIFLVVRYVDGTVEVKDFSSYVAALRYVNQVGNGRIYKRMITGRIEQLPVLNVLEGFGGMLVIQESVCRAEEADDLPWDPNELPF